MDLQEYHRNSLSCFAKIYYLYLIQANWTFCAKEGLLRLLYSILVEWRPLRYDVLLYEHFFKSIYLVTTVNFQLPFCYFLLFCCEFFCYSFPNFEQKSTDETLWFFMKLADFFNAEIFTFTVTNQNLYVNDKKSCCILFKKF